MTNQVDITYLTDFIQLGAEVVQKYCQRVEDPWDTVYLEDIKVTQVSYTDKDVLDEWLSSTATIEYRTNLPEDTVYTFKDYVYNEDEYLLTIKDDTGVRSIYTVRDAKGKLQTQAEIMNSK